MASSSSTIAPIGASQQTNTQAGGEDYMIKPQSVAPALDTSKWPLLLKNFDK